MIQDEKTKVFAVITGDIVKSRSFLDTEQRHSFLECLRETIDSAETLIGADCIRQGFTLFRGDSFQGVLSAPEKALRAALFIRSDLLQKLIGKKSIDVRMGIGIGTIKFVDENQIGLSDGEAFRYAGACIDKLESFRRLDIKSPWSSVNYFFKPVCAMLDSIISRWTPKQAQVITLALQDKTQEEIAEKISSEEEKRLSQSAVQQRQKTAGWYAIKETLYEFDRIVKENISRESNKNTI